MKRFILATATCLAVGNAAAQVQVKEPWVRATVPQQTATGAFMQLDSPQQTRLVEVRSPVAAVVELHETVTEKDVAKMRRIPGIEVPAGRGVELKPGGYHVMLTELKRQLKEGDSVPITLVFEGKDKKRETVELQVPVRPIGTPSGTGHGEARKMH